jgi:hypothetical protein
MKNYQAFDYSIVNPPCGWQKGHTVLVTRQAAPSRPEMERLFIALNRPRARILRWVQITGNNRWSSDGIDAFLAGLLFEQRGKFEDILIDFYFM